MISPDFLITAAKTQGVDYLYDANHDGVVDMKDIQAIKLAQSATKYHLDAWGNKT